MNDCHPVLRIAVVDDDRRVLESLRNLLESADHVVLQFSSAGAMLESGCLSVIDCLLSDIGMPGMDGFELLQVVQTARPELAIIFITGHSELLTRIPPFPAGGYRVFKKPFDGEELLATIREVGSRRAS